MLSRLLRRLVIGLRASGFWLRRIPTLSRKAVNAPGPVFAAREIPGAAGKSAAFRDDAVSDSEKYGPSG